MRMRRFAQRACSISIATAATAACRGFQPPIIMTSTKNRAVGGPSGAAGHHQEVITLLDSDSDNDGSSSPLPGATASRTASKPSSNGRKTASKDSKSSSSSAPFVPFHLYETTTAKSEFRRKRRTTATTKDNDPSNYFRTLRDLIGLDDKQQQQKQQRPKRKFQWLIIFNFLIDFSYLLEKCLPELLQFHRVIVFYGVTGADDAVAMEQWKGLLVGTGNTVEFIQLIPSDPPRSRTNPLPIKIPYGVHHTKMFLVGYEDEKGVSHCRVVVHTANLLLGDVEYKAQGAYCQDFPLKQTQQHNKDDKINNDNKKSGAVVNPYKRKRVDANEKQKTTNSDRGWSSEEDGENDIPFEEDLVTYLESYRYLTRQSWCSTSSSSKSGCLSNRPMSWLQLIRQYDYSRAYAVLIPSVPGRHARSAYHNYGYLKLRRAIVEWVCPHLLSNKQSSSSSSSRSPLLCQFSSIGSLSEKWLNQFISALDSSSTRDVDPINNNDTSGRKKNGKVKQHHTPLSSRMKIIWPTMDEIRRSIEGYQGGGSVPGKIKNLEKDFLLPLYHHWSSLNIGSGGGGSDPLKTARHVPHIKTFVQPSSSASSSIEWLVLTSHNLSTAAWGQLQQKSDSYTANEKVLFIRSWELGVFISPASLANAMAHRNGAAGSNEICISPYTGISGGGNSVINVDSDDEDDNENDAPKAVVPLPFDMNPVPYDDNDVPWACDRSCSVPDSFGCIMP